MPRTRPVDDLTGLKEGGFDYALLVDWKYMTRFDQLGKYDSFPRASMEAWRAGFMAKAWRAGTVTALAGESLGGFLISRELKAVKQFPDSINVFVRPPSQRDIPKTDDHAYMGALATYFAKGWGNGADDLGQLVLELNGILKSENK